MHLQPMTGFFCRLWLALMLMPLLVPAASAASAAAFAQAPPAPADPDPAQAVQMEVGPVNATDPAPDPGPGFSDAEALYNAGEFAAAVTTAGALNTPDGFALAARARLVLIRFFMPPEERRAAIAIALAEALRALEMDETHLEGNLQAAVAVGYRGRIRRSIRDAWAGKRYIDQAIAHHPESAWALAAQGAWNGEVVMEAGRFFASTLFGAKRKNAVSYFRAAIAAEPENLAIRAAFSKILLRFKRSRFEKEAINILSGTIALPARNALEELMQGQSRELLQALQEGRRDDLKDLLKQMTTFTDH